MIHWLRLNSDLNQADYGCRWVQTRGFNEESAAGSKQYVSITDAPLPLYIAKVPQLPSSRFTSPHPRASCIVHLRCPAMSLGGQHTSS